MSASHDVVAATFRAEFGAAVAVQEAFVVATQKWAHDGVPPNPGGWIVTTARRKALDRLRRETRRGDKERRAVRESTKDAGVVTAGSSSLPDDRLRLIFTCCHPALAPAIQIALTLRLLGGLEVSEIARAFFVPEETMAKRLVRAKAKIRGAHIPYSVPDAAELPDRLVLLKDQDRSRWSRPLIDEGHAIVRRLLLRNRPGPYQLQAAINAVHDDAGRADQTSWDQILALYDQLYAQQPTPVVALNRRWATTPNDASSTACASRARHHEPMADLSIQETHYPDLMCFGCGHANHKGLKLRSYEDGDEVRGTFTPWPEHDNGGGFLNGGIIATLLDCHGAAAVLLESQRRGFGTGGLSFVTAGLDVKYLRPTPLADSLELRAQLVETSDDEMTVRTSITFEDKARAEGVALWKRWKPRT